MSRKPESYSAAAARRAFENLTMQRETARPAPPKVSVTRTALQDPQPGAFSASACVENRYDHEIGMFIEPGALRPLPRAVLVHVGHDLESRPVAVAVPSCTDGVVRVDAVFSSSARDAWVKVQKGTLRSTSIYAHLQDFHRGPSGRMVKGVLIAVDLCPTGADPQAKLTRITGGVDLTPAQREVQHRFDRYLADPLSLRGLDFLAACELRGAGAEALDPLGPVVSPLIEGLPTPHRAATARPALTRSAEKRCEATMDGMRCSQALGHDTRGGNHLAEDAGGQVLVAWDGRGRPSIHARSVQPPRMSAKPRA